jgi:uncharacterized protein
MLKPVGARCNLNCGYCYYRDDAAAGQCMSPQLLDAVLKGFLPHAGDAVNICWQGGEPMLAGLDFFEEVLAIQGRLLRPGQRVHHALMTNATLIDEAWCQFLKKAGFLVGVSIDGEALVHDRYRRSMTGAPTHVDVARAVRLLKKHRVPHNLIAVVTDANVGAARATWEHLLALGGDWLQFIPAVEWLANGANSDRRLAPFVVEPRAYGQFLAELFDLWMARGRRRVTVRLFDSALTTLVLGTASVCTQARACNDQLTIEANGDVYACDHFATDAWLLGRVDPECASTSTWIDSLDGRRFTQFAERKTATSPRCERCEYLRFCFGGCPKHRPDLTAPTVLCEATTLWLRHALPRLESLAAELRRGVRRPLRRAVGRAS